MTGLLHLKIRADHVVHGNIVPDGGVCHDGPGGGALRAADDIDLEAVVVEVFHQLHHGQIKAIDIAHVLEAGGLLLAEVHRVPVEFLRGHARVGLGKVPCQILIGRIARFDGGGDLLQFLGHPLRVIVEAVLDEHHRVIIGVEGLAGQGAVHVEDSDPVLLRDEVFLVRGVRDLADKCPQFLSGRGICRPVPGQGRGGLLALPGEEGDADGSGQHQQQNHAEKNGAQNSFAIFHDFFLFKIRILPQLLSGSRTHCE